jgi:hypothetical protein
MPPGYLKEMPDPARVLASFGGSDNLDRTARQKAAFLVLRDMIYELSDGRAYRHQLTADEQRIYKSYGDAWGLVPTPHFDEAESRRLGWASPDGKWQKLQQVLRLDPAFRNELLDRLFSPAWKSNFLANQARQDQEVRDFHRRQEQQLASRSLATTVPTAHSTPGTWEAFLQGFKLTTVGLLILTFIVALRNESGPRLDVDAKEALRLPDALRRINVFRKEYDVSCQSGKLFDKELWTETNITTTTSGGGTYQSGGTTHSTPVTTSTHVSSTVWHRFWLRAADGHEFSTQFPGDAFSATKDQVISIIDSSSTVLMAYNHSTGQFATGRSWFGNLHKLPKTRWAWMVPGAAVVGFLWNVRTMMANLHTFFSFGVFLTCFVGIVWVFAVMIVWSIPTKILIAIITTTRNRQFEKRVVPAFRRFLKESTPELLARFPALPT